MAGPDLPWNLIPDIRWNRFLTLIADMAQRLETSDGDGDSGPTEASAADVSARTGTGYVSARRLPESPLYVDANGILQNR